MASACGVVNSKRAISPAFASLGSCARADEGDDLVDEVERLEEARDEVVALLGLAQEVLRAARDDDRCGGGRTPRSGA